MLDADGRSKSAFSMRLDRREALWLQQGLKETTDLLPVFPYTVTFRRIPHIVTSCFSRQSHNLTFLQPINVMKGFFEFCFLGY